VVYSSPIVGQFGDEVPLLSCSLPTPGPTEAAKTWAYLEGLLPEGQALDAMAARVRNVRLTANGEPESVNDVVLLLAEYGRECAGAVVFVPQDEPYEPSGGSYRLLDAGGLAAIVRELPEHPLGANPSRGIRMSLAGAQPKFLLARFDDFWYEPIDGAASTHIIKPTARWKDSAYNEALVMAVAKLIGLTSSAAWVETMGESVVFVAERFDRAVVGPQKVHRRHQEDMCQALGIRPSRKYDVGRPSKQMARLLREQATKPIVEIERLFQQVAFRVIVGDEDGHGKNYSVCLDDGQVTLSPLYDCLCTLIYPDLSGKMGAPVGRQQNLAKVDKQALLEEAVDMGILAEEAEEMLTSMTNGIEDALATLPAEILDGWESNRVVSAIRERIVRLNADEPMGRNDRPTPRRQATLDELTR
jgi:serine/threonine-protein kinase HipA